MIMDALGETMDKLSRTQEKELVYTSRRLLEEAKIVNFLVETYEKAFELRNKLVEEGMAVEDANREMEEFNNKVHNDKIRELAESIRGRGHDDIVESILKDLKPV